MRRLRRALVLLAASLAVSALVVVFRDLNAAGVFAGVDARSPGPCSPIAVSGGIEDLQIDPRDGLLFAALVGGATKLSTPGERDGIYAMALGRPETGFTRLSGTPANFHPTGLSLFRGGNGALVLAAVDHPKGQDPAIEIFNVRAPRGTASLVEIARVAGGLLVDPVAVAAAGPDQFYVTNGSTSATELGRLLEAFVLLPRGNVVFFDGNVLRIVANGLNSASGVQLSPDGTHVYVATATGRTLHTFARNPFSGALSEEGTLVIGAGLGNIRQDAAGDLWIAAHPQRLERSLQGPSARLATQVFKVPLSQTIPKSAALVYADSGAGLNEASVAAVAEGNLYVGGPNDSRLLRCRLQR
jgi:arylesterase/paraoxonase